MRTLLRLAYFAILYGWIFLSSRAFADPQGMFRPEIAELASIPEPGEIGLVSLLVVLLALQRTR